MTHKILALLFALSASASAAPVPKELLKANDAARLQGVWKQENGMRWYFDGEKLFVGGSNTTDNKGMEYAITKCANGVLDFGGGVRIQYFAIYEFSGDDLRLSYVGGRERPKDFTPRSGEFHHVMKPVPEAKK